MLIGIGTAIGQFMGAPLDASAAAVINAFTNKPNAQRQALINATILSLKAGGSWTTADVIGVPAAHDQQAATINWRNPATYTAVPVNSPTFTTDRGFAGDGSTSYVDTGFAGATAGDNFAQNTHCFAMWTDSDLTTNSIGFGGGAERIGIVPRRTDNLIQFLSSNGATVNTVGTVTTSKGLTMINRSGGSSVQIYKDGAQFETSTAGAFSQNTTTMKLGGSNVTGTTTHRFNGYYFGGSINGTVEAAYYATMKAYYDALGVSFT